MLTHTTVTRLIRFAILLAVYTPSHANNTLLAELQKSEEGTWTVEYKTPEPVKRIVFNNSPNNSRIERWSSISDEFEIRYQNKHESIQRKDGKAFINTSFKLTPTYTNLPKSYAPFSPLSDGGMIIHSGRFFACIDICNDEVNHWTLSLKVPKDEHIILNGEIHKESASWADKNSGKSIYIGKQHPVETAGTLSIIDQGLPKEIRQSLDENIPKLMVYFEQKLGKLESENKPTLFASYSNRPGNNRQGGTLPGQIFMHWDFDDLEQKASSTDYLNNTLKLFAHEAAHFFQAGSSFGSNKEAWLHEGSADLFAYNTLIELYPESKQYVKSQYTESRRQCIEDLATVSLTKASEIGKFRMHYHCGMLIHQRIKQELANSDSQKTIYTVWQEYRDRVNTENTTGQQAFLDVVEASTSTSLRQRIETFINEKHSDPKTAVNTLLSF